MIPDCFFREIIWKLKLDLVHSNVDSRLSSDFLGEFNLFSYNKITRQQLSFYFIL